MNECSNYVEAYILNHGVVAHESGNLITMNKMENVIGTLKSSDTSEPDLILNKLIRVWVEYLQHEIIFYQVPRFQNHRKPLDKPVPRLSARADLCNYRTKVSCFIHFLKSLF